MQDRRISLRGKVVSPVAVLAFANAPRHSFEIGRAREFSKPKRLRTRKNVHSRTDGQNSVL